MITVYVSLACATPTNQPDGEFGTYIAVPESDFRREVHLDIAKRRAGIVGYHGPYRVAQVREVGGPRLSLDEIRAKLKDLANPRVPRWLAVIEECEGPEVEVPPLAARPETKKPRSRARDRSRR